jgi:hypothetical protein
MPVLVYMGRTDGKERALMRMEMEKVVAEIEQVVSLLRRHL